MKEKKRQEKADKSLHTSFHSHIGSVKRISKNHLPHALKSNFKKIVIFFCHIQEFYKYERKSWNRTAVHNRWAEFHFLPLIGMTASLNEDFLYWHSFQSSKKKILTKPVWDESTTSVSPQGRELTTGVQDELSNISVNLKVSLRSL